VSVNDLSYYQRFQCLIDGLVAKTRESIVTGEPMWEKTGDDTYELVLARTSMRIYTKDGDGEAPYVFELMDCHGKIIETIVHFGSSRPKVVLRKLYELLSQANKLKAMDEVLRDALTELGIQESASTTPAALPAGGFERSPALGVRCAGQPAEPTPVSSTAAWL
jgi:hypothetical protein